MCDAGDVKPTGADLRKPHLILFFGGLLSLFSLQGASASTLQVLHSFSPAQGHPWGDKLFRDSEGNLFGVATGGAGLIYELSKKSGSDWKFQILYKFSGNDGSSPLGVIADVNGNLYGTTAGFASSGSFVFELSPNADRTQWTEKVLYTFDAQASPQRGLSYFGSAEGQPYDGVSALYGTTAAAGAHDGGAVFSLIPSGGSWMYQDLYDFCSTGHDKCTDGSGPLSLLVDESGNIFGTTLSGGRKFNGVVFELNNSTGTWTETVLHRFCSLPGCADGSVSLSPLAMDMTGVLYGTTRTKGEKPCKRHWEKGCEGTVFRLVPDGQDSELTTLYTFCHRHLCKDGAFPLGSVIIDASGTVFGVAAAGGREQPPPVGGGIVYSMDTAMQRIYAFCAEQNCADGLGPEGGVISDASGNFYGYTGAGGKFGSGTVYELTH